MSDPGWYRWDGQDLVLQLKLQPRASRDGFAGVQQGRLRIRITAPPVDGKANAHLCRWLARVFGVPKTAVTIEQGTASTLKRVRVRGPERLPDDIAQVRTG